MAATATGIKNNWSLIAFAKTFGPKMQVGEFANHETGETFKSTIFTNAKGERTFAAFSPKLGALTPQEIVERKDNLQVVECETKNGATMYSICNQGENAWEDVNLF